MFLQVRTEWPEAAQPMQFESQLHYTSLKKGKGGN